MSTAATVELRRSLGLTLLTLYGLGTIVGAGIYVLVGKVAGIAGIYAPVAFLLAALVAGVTALSYAELAARHPRSAAEAVYLQAAFGRRWLAGVAGWAVVAVGLVSSATLVNGFVGYAALFVTVPPALLIAALVLALATVAGWGIREAAWFAAVVTLVEIAGLLVVIVFGADALLAAAARPLDLLPPPTAAAWGGVALGAFLAFYAFIGFEDMVNVAEEVTEPQRTLPRAIVLALVAAALLYVLVALVAVGTLTPDELAASDAPLARLVGDRAGSATLLGVIGMIAVVNGALIQIVMASRMVYGLAQQRTAPVWFGAVHPRTRTPLRATALAALLVLGFALLLPLVTLAKTTSAITLLIFVGVNASLLRLKRAAPRPPGVAVVPFAVPLAGLLLCAGLLSALLWQ